MNCYHEKLMRDFGVEQKQKKGRNKSKRKQNRSPVRSNSRADKPKETSQKRLPEMGGSVKEGSLRSVNVAELVKCAKAETVESAEGSLTQNGVGKKKARGNRRKKNSGNVEQQVANAINKGISEKQVELRFPDRGSRSPSPIPIPTDLEAGAINYDIKSPGPKIPTDVFQILKDLTPKTQIQAAQVPKKTSFLTIFYN